MITPLEIRQKAARAYPRVLADWVKGQLNEFFPWTPPVNLSLKGEIGELKAAVDLLRSHSKNERGWGYTVHWAAIRKRDYGTNSVPVKITIDTLEDFLRLANKRREFAAACDSATRLREAFPALADWVALNIRTIGQHHASLEGLIGVTRFFLDNPWPDCYARQIPVPVDTKFVERHESVLWEWLSLLLPASAIDVDGETFASRYGLCDGQHHWAVRTLDPELQAELRLRFDRFSAPLRSLAALPVHDATIFILENRLPLLTLPPFPRGIAIWGEGDAVTQLRKLQWLAENRVVYWGDIDVEGFQSLSSLRGFFPDDSIHSIMMDLETLRCNADSIIAGNPPPNSEPPRLTEAERAAYRQCAEHCQRLEQEKIPQGYVEERIRELAVICHAANT
ncbi:MAG: Wadjet anti-phage system protein JetD domain-containing protein [Pirellulales bacterium]